MPSSSHRGFDGTHTGCCDGGKVLSRPEPGLFSIVALTSEAVRTTCATRKLHPPRSESELAPWERCDLVLPSHGHVSLAEQRRLFLARWRSLIAELAAAQGGVGCRGNPVTESIGDLRSDRALESGVAEV